MVAYYVWNVWKFKIFILKVCRCNKWIVNYMWKLTLFKEVDYNVNICMIRSQKGQKPVSPQTKKAKNQKGHLPKRQESLKGLCLIEYTLVMWSFSLRTDTQLHFSLHFTPFHINFCLLISQPVVFHNATQNTQQTGQCRSQSSYNKTKQ